MVTEDAAQVLRLLNGVGQIRVGGVADVIVVRDDARSPAQTLLDLRRIEMAIVGGRIRLVSDRLSRFAETSFQSITVEGRGRAWIDADIRALYRETVSRLGDNFKLAGRRLRLCDRC